jgi:hypothetical protein
MMLISFLTAALLISRYMPGIVVAIVAMGIGVNLFARARRVERRLILTSRRDLSLDYRPTRVER